MYDFKEARERRDHLVGIYRKLKHWQTEDGTWDWWIALEIEEIDREIAEAHGKTEKTVLADGLAEKLDNNIVAPIVTESDTFGNKERAFLEIEATA